MGRGDTKRGQCKSCFGWLEEVFEEKTFSWKRNFASYKCLSLPKECGTIEVAYLVK